LLIVTTICNCIGTLITTYRYYIAEFSNGNYEIKSGIRKQLQLVIVGYYKRFSNTFFMVK